MNRFKEITLGVALLFIFWSVVFALQPQPGDSTGIILGSPTNVGTLFLMLVQLAAGAITTYLVTKFGTKFPWIDGPKTVIFGTVIGAVSGLILNAGLKAVGLDTGLSYATNALGNYVIASLIYEFKTTPKLPPAA